jgi:hypothetical protein
MVKERLKIMDKLIHQKENYQIITNIIRIKVIKKSISKSETSVGFFLMFLVRVV